MTELTIYDHNINKFIRCNPLEITSLVIFTHNTIEVILNNLYKFVNLKKLNLNNNKIIDIKGLDNLVNLQQLYLSNSKISEIKGLEKLVNLQELYLSYNNITEIKGLDNLVNLQKIHLHNNKITEIKGLDNLVNLQKIELTTNDITEIKGLDSLVNLQKLHLCFNKITEIKGLNNLVNLQILQLSYNKITEIKKLDNLVNLQILNLYNNKITELPLSLCNFRNIIYFTYYNNPIEYIPLPVRRWLDRIDNRNNNNIYNDVQNVHNHTIQTSFRNSLTNLLKDKLTINLETVKNEIINNEILKVLNQEITDGLCMCFTGRLTRLLNVLVGFYDDIELQISDSEQITNIIMSLKNKYDDEQLKEAVKKELLERQYSEAIINEWLEYI